MRRIQFNRVKKLTNQDETDMLQWIQDSTMMVGIDVDPQSFFLYEAGQSNPMDECLVSSIIGIYESNDCSSRTINHVVRHLASTRTYKMSVFSSSWLAMGWRRTLPTGC
jgi:hypothetical protein